MVEKDFDVVNLEYFKQKYIGNDNHAINFEEQSKKSHVILDISNFQSGSSYA